MNLVIKKNIGWVVVLILSLIPVIRWFFIAPLDFRFANFNVTFTSLGQIAGLLGMTLFAITLILSTRIKILDRFFYGLPDMYNLHQRMGQISFILLLFHPLFLVVKYFSFSLRDAAMFLLPHGFDAVSYGIYALVGMIILIALTIYIKLKYPTWKISHKFMVLVFVIALLHVLLITSDISNDIFLRYYIFTISIIALGLSFYQAFLSMYINRSYNYKVKRVTNLGDKIVEIELEPDSLTLLWTGKLKFEAGQFIFVKFHSQAVTSESHPFSISSDPQNSSLKIIVKSLGDYTSKIGNLSVGDKAVLCGPFGKFNFKNAEFKNQVWLAGGIGITPFLSMASKLNNTNDYKIDLFYCVKNKSEMVLAQELNKISENNKNFRVIFWCSDDSGFINANEILKLSGNVLNKDFFLCGPTGFMVNLKNQLLKLNVKNINIHWENFNFFN